MHSKTNLLVTLLLTGLLGLAAAPLHAQDEEPVYGRELMTEQERAEHREKMRTMQTEQERHTYREEHHKKMQERAKERGVSLPEEPLQRGMGRQGKGMGQERGQGQGLDKNQGQGRGQGQGGGQGGGRY